MSSARDGHPYVKILEQPSSKELRFRYECEKKYAAAIVGVNSEDDHRTYPTIKIMNCTGPAHIVLSCVTNLAPHRPHPHNLIGKIKEVSNGICHFKFEKTEMALSFDNLSVQCVKKKDIAKSLAVRQSLRVDPFNTGFDHALDPDNIDLHSLRLCFQVFLEGSTPGNFNVPLQPVITEPIFDRRSKSEPEIVFLTHDEDSVAGGVEMSILCERADKKDTIVMFCRGENNWEAVAELKPPKVHKGVSIVIKVPPYVDQTVTEPVEVTIHLRKRSTGAVSNSFPFTYLPLELAGENPLKRKRKDGSISEQLQKQLAKNINTVYIPKCTDIGNLVSQPRNDSVDCSRELASVTDLSVNAYEYRPNSETPDPNANISQPKKSKPRARKSVKKESSITQVSKAESPSTTNVEQPKDEPKPSNYLSTLDSGDWIAELLQTIEEDPLKKNKEPEIVKEPEITYITPHPIPNITNPIPIPEVQNCNNFMINNIVNNNHELDSSLNISNFIENIPPLSENFASNVNTLANIPELQEPPVISHSHLIHGQHPQYAMNINENLWSNTMNYMTNGHGIPQMPVDNNGQSGNYMISNGFYDTPIQPINQERTWDQVQRATLNDFDPLYSAANWHTPQGHNGCNQ